MCRSIKRLRQPAGLPSEDEIRAAARQFVRKISGFQKPSRNHEAAFQSAIEEIAGASRKLLDALPPAKTAPSPPVAETTP
ncbi:MAG: DUF2277 domain-containing protein [Bryobacteraceae bacterium]|nr:DUF2277 domain-containing protein [Bryobacteraceae bacterium]